MTPSHDPFGRPLERNPTTTTLRDAVPSAGDEPRSPARGPGRCRALFAVLAGGIVMIAATMTFAVGWARDLPKTIAFAVAREPYGERSLLNPAQAQAGLERVLARVDSDERVTAIYLDEDRISVWTRQPDGFVAIASTAITGETEKRKTANVAEERGVALSDVEAIDLVDGARASQTRWEQNGTRPEAPMARLEIEDGRIRGWRVTFTSEVPEGERSVLVGLDGRVRR